VFFASKALAALWKRAGGPADLADTMAAIAIAESNGNPLAVHHDSDGTVDRGLWQINSDHGYPAALSFEPFHNAQQAVAVWRSSGLTAWSTYNSGAYLQYMTSGGSRVRGRLVDPVPDSSYARVDQGTDYVSRKPVEALADGVIVSHGGGMAGGTGDIIKQRFDQPVSVRGRVYYGAYYSEQRPLVRVGQHVKAGQPVMAPGPNEVGYLVGQDLALPPLVGGLGAGTEPTQPGSDFEATVAGLGGPGPRGRTAARILPASAGAGGQAIDHGPAVSSSPGSGTLVDQWHASLGDPLGFIPILGPLLDSIDSVVGFLKLGVWLIDPRNWLRLFEVIVGGVLMLLGFVGLGVMLAARNEVVQEAAGHARLLPGPLGGAGRAVTAAGAATSRSGRRFLAAERVPQRIAERAATQQGEREERQSQRRKRIAQARASGRRRVQAARTRQDADRFGTVPF
jgi:lysozyme-like protein